MKRRPIPLTPKGGMINQMKKSNMSLGANYLIYKNAGNLRNSPTAAESLLWGYLSGNQLGVKFRRQHPLGIYIADFYCHQCKLIIELDGSIHNRPDILENDIIRERNLLSEGFSVLRFRNDQVFSSI
jgi:cyclase